MARISEFTSVQLRDLQEDISVRARTCASLEQAAQMYTSILHEQLGESIVLARFFATIPFRELPEPNQRFVKQLVDSARISYLLKDHTLVLTLLGTSGADAEWNDRRRSRGHVGIPLASSDFIDAIPMMSRLLKQLGAGLDWIDSNDTELVLKTVGSLSGVFYVRDARTEVDQKGRKIIVADEFVETHDVKTVFGVGGGYLGSSMLFTTIVFVREHLEKSLVERFMIQATKFKTATLYLVEEGKIFAAAPEPSRTSAKT